MKNQRGKLFFLGLISTMAMSSAPKAYAFYGPAAFGKNNELFSSEEIVKKEELDKMRGGFITSNGMIIDFSFSANTLVDGKLINQIALNTANLAASSNALRSIVQIGEGNSAFKGATDISTLPDVLSVIQNNLDNLTIQQINILDLQVQNISNYSNRSIATEINFQNTLRLAP